MAYSVLKEDSSATLKEDGTLLLKEDALRSRLLKEDGWLLLKEDGGAVLLDIVSNAPIYAYYFNHMRGH